MHLDNLFVLLLITAVALLRLLASKAGRAKKKSQEPKQRSPVPRSPANSDEERIRKFLEALGQPASSKPPPPVTSRRTYQKPVVLPHVPPFASPLPPLKTRPADLPRKITLPQPSPKPTSAQKLAKPKVEAAPVFEVPQAMPPSEPPAPTTPAEAYAIVTAPKAVPARGDMDVTQLLKSPSGLRSAIVLREVFGPPRSLQPLDLIAL